MGKTPLITVMLTRPFLGVPHFERPYCSLFYPHSRGFWGGPSYGLRLRASLCFQLGDCYVWSSRKIFTSFVSGHLGLTETWHGSHWHRSVQMLYRTDHRKYACRDGFGIRSFCISQRLINFWKHLKEQLRERSKWERLMRGEQLQGWKWKDPSFARQQHICSSKLPSDRL